MSSKYKQFRILLALALCDDKLHPAEVELLHRLAARRHIAIEEYRDVVLHPEQVIEHDFDKVDIDFAFLYELAEMVLADDVIDDAEMEFLTHCIDRSGFARDNVEGWSHYLIDLVEAGMPVEEVQAEMQSWGGRL